MNDKIEYSAEFAGNYRVTMQASAGGIALEWSPKMPQFENAEKAAPFLETYRKWRDECLSDFAKKTGVKILMVDL